jgi:hypothetical protein
MVLALLVGVLPGTACDGYGEYDGGVIPDGGLRDAGPTGADIGTPCTYRYDGQNPTNDCPAGLQCFIFTADGEYTTNLALPTWEDQFTLYKGDVDEGYCTLIGTLARPPACPAGSVLKVFSTDITACVRTCSQPADCGRPGYTCDVRYYDVIDGESRPIKTCVKECSFDVPDCVRSGIILNPQNQQQLIPALAFQDLAGESQCAVEEGVCAFVTTHGTAGPGEPCTRTEQCEAGSVCLQGPILAAVLSPAVPLDPDAPGFCASPCTPVLDPQGDPGSNCSFGYVCQAAGNLTLGFPFTTVIDLRSGGLDLRGGFCFHQCVGGIEGACNPIPGTGCGSFDELAADDDWNGVPMCLPDAIRR